MRREFMKTLTKLAEKDSRIVLLYGDVKQCMDEFERKFPERIFNMGNAEQSMVGIAAGMALEGLRPVVYTITPFIIRRAMEQVILDVDQQKASVILAGFDSCYETQGITHSGSDARALSGVLKNTACYFPNNPIETRDSLVKAMKSNSPAFFSLTRYQE